MCGIAGILLAPSSDRRLLRATAPMATALLHRGPDACGLWSDQESGIALGHRRLAIVDLSEAGIQPMHSPGQRYVVSFNGEIYGFAELRARLEARGVRFRGHSDTEVMLAAFEAWGIEQALQQMAGMFAIGLWDRTERVLHLIRDRMGKKPLYVAIVKGALLFASELKAFRAFPGWDPQIRPEAIAAMLRQGWIPDDQCVWTDVFKVPPGSVLSIRAEDLAWVSASEVASRARSWWSLAQAAQPGVVTMDEAAASAELDALLRAAVGERMVADVPMGAFLSGGVDSSLVVALMQAQSACPVRTFTIGFDQGGYDEAAPARDVAAHLGTEHTEFRLTTDVVRATIPDLPHIWDEPFADESQIPTLLVSRLARQHVTVALTGDGGDEGFGGYNRHMLATRLAPVLELPLSLRRAGAAAVRLLDGERWEAGWRVPFLGSSTLRRSHFTKIAAALAATDEEALYDGLVGFGRAIIPLHGSAPRAGSVPLLPDLASRLMYRDMARYLPGDILVKLDRASMAVSLESRCPLLDHRVIEFAWRLPLALKVRDGKGKWLLRQALRRYLPDKLIERPKHGFDVPIGAWLRGPLRPWAENLLDNGRVRGEGLLDPAAVRACWREHLSGARDGAGALWSVLMLQGWLDAQRTAKAPRRGAAELTPMACEAAA